MSGSFRRLTGGKTYSNGNGIGNGNENEERGSREGEKEEGVVPAAEVTRKKRPTGAMQMQGILTLHVIRASAKVLKWRMVGGQRKSSAWSGLASYAICKVEVDGDAPAKAETKMTRISAKEVIFDEKLTLPISEGAKQVYLLLSSLESSGVPSRVFASGAFFVSDIEGSPITRGWFELYGQKGRQGGTVLLEFQYKAVVHRGLLIPPSPSELPIPLFEEEDLVMPEGKQDEEGPHPDLTRWDSLPRSMDSTFRTFVHSQRPRTTSQVQGTDEEENIASNTWNVSPSSTGEREERRHEKGDDDEQQRSERVVVASVRPEEVNSEEGAARVGSVQEEDDDPTRQSECGTRESAGGEREMAVIGRSREAERGINRGAGKGQRDEGGKHRGVWRGRKEREGLGWRKGWGMLVLGMATVGIVVDLLLIGHCAPSTGNRPRSRYRPCSRPSSNILPLSFSRARHACENT